MKKLQVDVWSDVVCPWCYVGKRRLEAALDRFAHRADVEIVWRAFELDRSAPRTLEPGISYIDRLARKYGKSKAEAEGMIQNLTAIAAKDGLDFHFERIRPGNTFDAHRLLHLAVERGVQDAVKERFFLGYLTEGAAIGDADTLARLATEAGLDSAEVRAVLSSDRYAREVRAEEEEAQTIGIRGVPFFVFDGRLAISGAQPADAILGVLERAWSELKQVEPVQSAEGAACGPDGCA